MITLKESLLDDIETTYKDGGKLLQVVEWWKAQRVHARIKTSAEAEAFIADRIRIENKALIIDCKDAKDTVLDGLFVKDSLPFGINTIKVYNCKSNFYVYAHSEDISFVDFEIYTDEGRTYGDIYVHGGKLQSLDLGNIVCCKLKIHAQKIKALLIGKNSEVIEYDLQMCYDLERFYGNFMGASDITIPKQALKNYLCQQGFMSWGAELNIKN